MKNIIIYPDDANLVCARNFLFFVYLTDNKQVFCIVNSEHSFSKVSFLHSF